MKTVNDKMRENNDKEKKFAYPLVANSVESSVIVEKLSLQSPSQPGSANVRTGEGVGGGLTTEVGYRGNRLPRGPLSSCSGYHGE